MVCALLSRHPGGKQLEAKELISLESLLLAGQKKAPKIYTLAVHPLQPHIVAVGANAGKTLCTDLPVVGVGGLSVALWAYSWHALLLSSV